MHGKQGAGSTSSVDLERGHAGAGYWLRRDSGGWAEVTGVQHPLCEQRCGERKGLGTHREGRGTGRQGPVVT